jgi:hypothetical protein
MHALDARDLLDAEHALVACLMREPGGSCHVADRIDAGSCRAIPFIDDDVTFLDLDSLFKPKPLDIAGDADCEDDAARA